MVVVEGDSYGSVCEERESWILRCRTGLSRYFERDMILGGDMKRRVEQDSQLVGRLVG